MVTPRAVNVVPCWSWTILCCPRASLPWGDGSGLPPAETDGTGEARHRFTNVAADKDGRWRVSLTHQASGRAVTVGGPDGIPVVAGIHG